MKAMNTREQIQAIPSLPQAWRIVALGVDVVVAWLVFFLATGTTIPTGSGASVWFLAAVAYWLLTLVAAPFFVPPRDALSTAIATVLLLAPLDLSRVAEFHQPLIWLTSTTIVFAILVGIIALVAAFQQNTLLGRIAYRISSLIGKGEVLFTPVVVVSALGFYQTQRGWAAAILGLWTLGLAIRPVDVALRIGRYLAGLKTDKEVRERTGTLLRVDDPDVVRVSLVDGCAHWTSKTVHVAQLPNGKSTYILPLFAQMQNEEMMGTGLCCSMVVPDSLVSTDVGAVYAVADAGLAVQLRNALCGDDSVSDIVGIVSEGSAIANIKFQVVPTVPLEEGMVVFALMRGKKIYYQILDAHTREETFQQNPFGTHIVSAAQLGVYDDAQGFQKFPWLPSMNQPLFLLSPTATEHQTVAKNEFLIGSVPNTPFGVPVILDDLIEYHTAVLGITGTGKTELTLDIIRNALTRDAKVFCVDFTGEYRARLADQTPSAIGLTIAQGTDLEKYLFAVETGTYGAPKEKGELKAFLDGITPQVTAQIEGFLKDPKQRLGIFELSEITNTKATLRTTELYLSAIMDWARKNRKAQRILIVLEEAHTIIPEAFGAGFDKETLWVVGRIGQIALQGRKYGVGLLLVSQRTALVSKTVLSQCSTYFTHALVDKTSLDYLSGVYSAEHVQALPNLRFLEFLAYGKGVKSQRPILARRKFDEAKLLASRALDAKKL